MERELLKQIWPIFSAEAREHLSAIGGGVLELEQDPSRSHVLEAVRRTAHSLKGSAGSLGILGVERLAHAIEGALSGFDPAQGVARATVMAVLDAVHGVEDALDAGDAGGEAEVRRLPELLVALGATPPAEPKAVPDERAAAGAPVHGASALDLVAQLEEACSELVRPLGDGERARRAEAAGELARQLAGVVAGSPVPARLVSGLGAMAAGGAEGARAAARVAGDLVELRAALESGQPVEEKEEKARPAEEKERHAEVPVHAGPADRSIRVLASTMDSLTRQMELLSLGETRHRRRVRAGARGGAVPARRRARAGAGRPGPPRGAGRRRRGRSSAR